MHIAFGVASGGMTQASNTAREIPRAVAEAHSAGRTPRTIIRGGAARWSLQGVGLGCGSAGAAWSLANAPVVIGLVQGWRRRLWPEPSEATG